MKKWTILIVNYKSNVYLKWQFKILYDFNDPQDFEVIIVDNSVEEEEKNKLEELSKNYKSTYQNIKILYFQPTDKTASGQHGQGIEFGKKYANSEYLLVQDPDFFWLKNQYLNHLEQLLQNSDAVGAPYPKKVAEGHPYFPSAFGCAYQFSKVKDVSFEPYIDNDIEKSWQKYKESNAFEKGLDFYYDVGWMVRKALSLPSENKNFISFSQLNIKNELLNLLKLEDSHSYETNTRLYFWNNEVICLHLFRGTFTGKVTKYQDPQLTLSLKIIHIRDKIGEFMYKSIGDNNTDLNAIANKLRLYFDSFNEFKNGSHQMVAKKRFIKEKLKNSIKKRLRTILNRK